MLAIAVGIFLAQAKVTYPAYAVPRLHGQTIPGLPDVDGHLHVDQFGYLPTEPKVLVISDPQKGFNASDHFQPGNQIEFRNQKDGKIVLTASPEPWNNGATHEDSGDKGWWVDFSQIQTAGVYYAYDPTNKVRSPLIRIGDKVYTPVLRAAERMFYHQREGIAHEARFTEGPWTEGPAFLQDAHAKSVEAKNDPSQERDMSGGWMDAGDTDKYPPFNAEVIHPLLYAYRANPKAFGDATNIPESGNGLPDLLDEVKYQLDWLVRCQFEDGSLPVKMGNIDYNSAYPTSADQRPRYYGPKDTGATIYAAAIFAHAARVYKEFDAWKPFAEELKTRALKAWDYYHSHPKTTKTDTGEIKSGIANRSPEEQDRMEAICAIHLLALTGDAKYNEIIRAKAPLTRQLTEWTWSPYDAGSTEALTDYLSMPQADPDLKARIVAQLTKSATDANFCPAPADDLYRAKMPSSQYHWGSNTIRAYDGVVALLAAKYAAVDDATKAKLRHRAEEMLHSFHGVNPLAVTYLTNMEPFGAENSLHHIYHERFRWGSVFSDNPPPGYVVGGPNQQYSGKNADGTPSVDWVRAQPRAKAYLDTSKPWPESSWEITEPAIYYQAAYIRLLAEFVH